MAARAALQSGDIEAAMARWNGIEPQLHSLQPADCYPLTPAAVGVEILRASGSAERSAALLAEALGWLRLTALPQVPEAFRDSFLHRNPVNRALLNAEGRLQ
jgi:hypothetical protein